VVLELLLAKGANVNQGVVEFMIICAMNEEIAYFSNATSLYLRKQVSTMSPLSTMASLHSTLLPNATMAPLHSTWLPKMGTWRW
jgi:hypothetical protein